MIVSDSRLADNRTNRWFLKASNTSEVAEQATKNAYKVAQDVGAMSSDEVPLTTAPFVDVTKSGTSVDKYIDILIDQ